MCLHEEYTYPENDSRFYRKFKPELSLSNHTVTYCKKKKLLIDDFIIIPDSIRQACKTANVPLLYNIYIVATEDAKRLGRDVLKIYMNIISLPAFRGATYEDSDIYMGHGANFGRILWTNRK